MEAAQTEAAAAIEASTTESSSSSPPPRLPPPDRIAFGSCNSQHYPESPVEATLWPIVAHRNPAAFLWTGDAVYADDFETAKSALQYLFGRPVPRPADPEHIRDEFHKLLKSPGYRRLLDETNATILGTIDDHDYGCNNGDKTYPHKTESNVHYVDFLRASNRRHQKPDNYHDQDHDHDTANLTIMARRAHNGRGVYGVKVFDFDRRRRRQQQALMSDEEAGLEPDIEYNASIHELSNRSVAVFLLDVRSNKSPWPTGRWDKYRPDYDADFLGEEQWEWFQQALSRSTARINLIVQGLQVHADRYFDGNTVESWSRFPSSQHRLYQTLLRSGVRAPILLSGDVHMSELLLKDCRQPGLVNRATTDDDPNLDRRRRRYLLEVTSSGLTHAWGGPSICARPHSSLPCQSPTVALGLQAGMHWAHQNGAWTDLVDLRDPSIESLVRIDDDDKAGIGAKVGVQYVLQRSFGELEFDWDSNELVVRLFGHGRPNDQPFLATRWNLDALDATHPTTGPSTLASSTFEGAQNVLRKHGSAPGDDDWLCVNYRGQPSFLLKVYGVITPVLLAGTVMALPILLPAAIAYVILSKRRKSAKHTTEQVLSKSLCIHR